MKELEKNYDPQAMEPEIYKNWLEKDYFHAEANSGKKPFSIMMPPPNVTGQLHMGHALDNTLQDSLCRFKRMQGYEVLWQPGTDHAAIDAIYLHILCLVHGDKQGAAIAIHAHAFCTEVVDAGAIRRISQIDVELVFIIRRVLQRISSEHILRAATESQRTIAASGSFQHAAAIAVVGHIPHIRFFLHQQIGTARAVSHVLPISSLDVSAGASGIGAKQ